MVCTVWYRRVASRQGFCAILSLLVCVLGLIIRHLFFPHNIFCLFVSFVRVWAGLGVFSCCFFVSGWVG